MGRPEVPVDFTIPARGELASYLRSLRYKSGLTYTQLSQLTEYSSSHLKRLASGTYLGTWPAVYTYAMCCDNELDLFEDQLRALYLRARKAIRASKRSSVVPKPQYVRTLAGLGEAMYAAWERAGRPSRRVIQSRCFNVPRSTAHFIIVNRAVPTDLPQYIDFLNACEVSTKDLEPWLRAWFKVRGATLDRRQLSRYARVMTPAEYKLFEKTRMDCLAESYDEDKTMELLTDAIDLAMDTVQDISNEKKHDALFSMAQTLDGLARVQHYIRQTAA
ncbi:helix-turn-helix domain-containing protein [Streptomyces sp. bgisy082]|uniref:helix-turn-helix domain-containing protein n=1 Tax=Streptomyces sp. bgisy082 TaxID=3413776 RepID=UPI003D727F5F